LWFIDRLQQRVAQDSRLLAAVAFDRPDEVDGFRTQNGGPSRRLEGREPDPNADAQEQARQLSAVVSSGSAGALFIVAISPSSFRQVVRDAQAKGIPVVTTA
jgi:hypothetical protein